VHRSSSSRTVSPEPSGQSFYTGPPGRFRYPGADRAIEALRCAVFCALLFAVVACAIFGLREALFGTVALSWLLMPLLFGLRNTLDAECAFMSLMVGILFTVGVAQEGLAVYSLPPTGSR
jgi:hypothetical protein